MERRGFLLLAASGSSYFWPTTSWAASPDDAIRNAVLAIGASTATDPLTVVFADRATRTLAAASAGERKMLQGHLDELATSLFHSTDLARQVPLLRSGLAIDIGFSKSVSEAVSHGRLIPTPAQFLEIVKPGTDSFMQQASTAFQEVLQRPGAELLKSQVYGQASKILHAAGGLEPAQALTFMLNQAGISLPAPDKFFGDLFRGAANPLQMLDQVRQQVLDSSSAGVSTAVSLLTQNAKGASSQLDDAFSDARNQFRQLNAGAGALFSVLNMLGPQAAPVKQVLSQAVAVAQGAQQIFQAVSIIGGLFTGGALPAISGLLNGLGGLGGLFGGGGSTGDPKAEARHREVMAAIKNLRAEMLAQFSRVNVKLDYVIGQLNQVLQEVVELRVDVRTLMARVQDADARTQLVLLNAQQVSFRRMSNQTELDLAGCTAPVSFGVMEPQYMAVCLGKNVALAKQLSHSGWVEGGQDTPAQAVERLKQALASPELLQKTGSSVRLHWSAAGALKPLLRQFELDTDLAGSPAYEPMLLQMSDAQVALKTGQPKTYAQLGPAAATGAYVAPIRGTFAQHAAFLQSLQTPGAQKLEDNKILSRLVSEYQRVSKELAAQVATMTQAYAQERLDRPAWKGAAVIQVHAKPDKSIQLLSPADFSSGEVPERLISSVVPRPAGFQAMKIFASGASIKARTPKLLIDLEFWVTHVDLSSYFIVKHPIQVPPQTDEAAATLVSRLQENLFETLTMLTGSDAETLSELRGLLKPFLNETLAKQIEEHQRELVFQRHMRHFEWEALRTAPELGGDRPKNSVPALDKLDALSTAIRAVCLFGFPSVVDSEPSVLGLLYGHPRVRLLDKGLLKTLAAQDNVYFVTYWHANSGDAEAEKKRDASDFSRLTVGSLTALLRTTGAQVSTAAYRLVDGGYRQGFNVPFEVARATFDKTFPA